MVITDKGEVNMILTEEQKEIVEAPVEEKTLVIANAASGKTRVLTERVRFLLQQGIAPEKIVCITFTNNAANEMKQRLKDVYDSKLFIGTIHSYANMLLTRNGIDTRMYIQIEDFEELFNLVAANRYVIPQLDYVLCDESQDLAQHEYDFIIEMLNSKGYLIVGDPKQSIYGFKGGDPELTSNLADDWEWRVRVLVLNFRNSVRINRLANEIIDTMKGIHDKSKTVRLEAGEVSYYRFFDLARIIKEQAHEHYANWAVLCRSNAQVNAVRNMLHSVNIPTTTFKQGDTNLEGLKEHQEKNAVKVLTVHSAKGLEFDNVMLADKLQTSLKGENGRLFYVALTRAKDHLYLRK